MNNNNKSTVADNKSTVSDNSKVYEMKLSSPWFEHVKQGTKIYEGRRLYGDRKVIVPGDTIKFTGVDDCKNTFQKQVQAIHKFPTFEIALTKLGLEKVLPGTTSISDGIEIYKKYVSLETQIREGIVMFELI